MYRGNYIFTLPHREDLARIEEMLLERLHAECIELEETSGTFYLSFQVEDNRKVFVVATAIQHYGGEIERKWIKPVHVVEETV